MKITLTMGEWFQYVEEFTNQKFKDNQEVSVTELELKVPTPSGLAPVEWMIKKENLPSVRVQFSNGLVLECAEKHILVDIDDNDVFVSDLEIGDFVQHQNGLIAVTSIESKGQEDCFDIGIPEPHHYYDANGILHHNTIITGALSKLCEPFGRTLIIVPSKSLVTQTEVDYRNIGLDVGVFYGDRKEIGKTHTISTWQSLSSLGKKDEDADFTIYDMLEGVVAVVVDEGHSAKGDELQKMLCGPMANIPIRWGLTGTIPKDEVDRMRLLLSIGPVVGNITAAELQEKGVLAQCQINILQLDDNHVEFKSYQDEKEYLTSDPRRMDYIASLSRTLAEDGNTLILIDRIEAGHMLQDLIPDSVFVNGSVKNSERKEEYDSIQESNNKVIIATYGVAAVGINIPRIFHLVLIEPGKSFVRVIQSIGRGIRKAKDKDHVDVWDLTSTLKFSAKHMKARKEFYRDAQYPHSVQKIDYLNNKNK